MQTPAITGGLKAAPVPIQWHSGLSIYASEPFLKTAGDEYGWLGGLDASGKLRCILPYTIIRKAIFRMVRFRTEPIPWEKDLTVEEEKSFLDSAAEYLRSTGADLIIPGSQNAIFRTYPSGALAAPYGSFVVDLTLPEETLWKNVHSGHRHSIKRATTKGVTFKHGPEYLDAVEQLTRDTLKRSKLSFMAHEDLRRMIGDLGPNVKIMVAEFEGKIQGGVIVPFSGASAYSLYGGTHGTTVSGASNVMYWEAFRLFKSLGVKKFDFTGVRINPEKGSKQEGILNFKARFGGELKKGFMWKFHFRPLKSLLYSLAARVRGGGDIVDKERHKMNGAPAQN